MKLIYRTSSGEPISYTTEDFDDPDDEYTAVEVPSQLDLEGGYITWDVSSRQFTETALAARRAIEAQVRERITNAVTALSEWLASGGPADREHVERLTRDVLAVAKLLSGSFDSTD